MAQTNHPLTLDSQISQCTGCGEVFSNEANFDRHRQGKGKHRYCVDPTLVGLEIKYRPKGKLWGMPGPK